MTDQHNDAPRDLNNTEVDLVAGGRMLTTLALGEEDGWGGGGRATTMAIGEEDGGHCRLRRPLDALLHLKSGS